MTTRQATPAKSDKQHVKAGKGMSPARRPLPADSHKEYVKPRKGASPSTPGTNVGKHIVERKATESKAALVRAVVHDLEGLTIAELRSFKYLVETKRLKGKHGSVVSAYVPDVAVNATVAFKDSHGSTWIGRASTPSGGQFVVVVPNRRAVVVRRPSESAVAPAATKRGALNRARAAYESVRNNVVAESLSLTKAAVRMNLTTEGLSARVDRGEMLAFTEHNRKMVPIEVIDDDQPDRTVQGLSDVIKAAEMEPFRLAVWLLHPARSLGDKRPIDELRTGNVERVVRAVRSVDAS